ncbi:ubiquitin carboxyl-terminal hydrolase 30 isoform X1 [Halyomorpha halys]|uniref:ubiquitin carboxyl-terminal hydrolase 30 isoform X1 n=1 Tax=Halyomorpha halys TaxID=286706 RepID=UPI000D0C7D50|nr:ubiquitin carboxyl-terminal hydrolase 30 homolog isoform X1 [Halyomorpha halys]
MSSQDDIEMDKDSILLFGITACALGLSLFIFWGPKLSRRGSYNTGKLIGLQNLGLTCFLNSLLQGLAACPSLLDWLEPCQRNGYVSSSLYTILRVLCYERQPDDGTEAVISPEDLIYGLRRKNYWSSLQEQDPHELFLHLISAVEEEEQKAKPQRSNSLLDALDLENKTVSNGRGPEEQCQGDAPQIISRSIQQPLATSRIISPFRGYLASQLCCLRCGHKSAVVYDKFDTLSLPLPTQSSHSTYGLGRLLSDFVRAELVDGFSCDGCSAEHGPSQASKAIKIGKLPKCLCFHICRTVIDSGGYIYKRENTVVFPEHLSMSEYTHTSHMINEKKKLKLKGGDAEMAAAVRNGSLVDENSIAAALNNNFSLPVMKGPVYQLKAVVEHRGTVESGHFVTYRRGPLEHGDSSPTDSHHQSRWYYTSDNIVKKSSLNEVLTASAYLLFYEKTVFPAL